MTKYLKTSKFTKSLVNLFLSHGQETGFHLHLNGVLENTLVCVQFLWKLANVTKYDSMFYYKVFLELFFHFFFIPELCSDGFKQHNALSYHKIYKPKCKPYERFQGAVIDRLRITRPEVDGGQTNDCGRHKDHL